VISGRLFSLCTARGQSGIIWLDCGITRRLTTGAGCFCWNQSAVNTKSTQLSVLPVTSSLWPVMESWDTCLVSRLSQDVVFHFSVLAQSRHLYVLSWLCLEFPCLVMSRVSWLCLCQA